VTSTPNIELPEFGAAGVPSGTELTRGMRRLDALVQLSVIGFETTPPTDPDLGDRYIVDTGGTGDWAGRDLFVAFWSQDGWQFFVPRPGWLALIGTDLWTFDQSIPSWVPATVIVEEPPPTLVELRTHSGSDTTTLAIADCDKCLEMDRAGANTVTFPQDSDVAIPLYTVGLIRQIGAGQTTLVAGTGATVSVPADFSLLLRGQYSLVSWHKRAANHFVIAGDLVQL
jgi:hypothetical protein